MITVLRCALTLPHYLIFKTGLRISHTPVIVALFEYCTVTHGVGFLHSPLPQSCLLTSPVTLFINSWAVSLFRSGPPPALLQGITAGNYQERTLIVSNILQEFHSHLIESGSETITGHVGYVYPQLHHFFKNAPVRETSCQPTANWWLPYALVVRLDPDVPLSFWLVHMDTSTHTPMEIRGAPSALHTLLLQTKAI